MGNFSQHVEIAGLSSKGQIYSLRMQDKIQKQILDAFFVVLRPIAKILLRYGIGFREFAEVAKSAYVDVATSEYGIRGRPTNISRVAVMTGLTRKEVRRLRDQLKRGETFQARKHTPLSNIVHKWNTEPEFLDANGEPLTLEFSGGELDFSELVRRFAGDVPPGAIRTELRRIGAVEVAADGKLKLLRRDIYSDLEHENLCLSLMHGAYPMLESIQFNTSGDNKGESWAQKTVFNENIDHVQLPKLRRLCKDLLSRDAESFDDVFARFESQSMSEDSSKETAVAMGVFYFEEREAENRYIWQVE